MPRIARMLLGHCVNVGNLDRRRKAVSREEAERSRFSATRRSRPPSTEYRHAVVRCLVVETAGQPRAGRCAARVAHSNILIAQREISRSRIGLSFTPRRFIRNVRAPSMAEAYQRRSQHSEARCHCCHDGRFPAVLGGSPRFTPTNLGPNSRNHSRSVARPRRASVFPE